MSTETHLESLKTRHKELDRLIKEGYSNYIADHDLSKMKMEKAMLKSEIAKIELALASTS